MKPVADITPEQKQNLLNIIKQSVEKEGGGDFNVFMQKLASILQDPNNKLIHLGNTVFLVKRVPPDTAEVHTFSIDSPQNIVPAFQALAKVLKNQGIKKAITYAANPAYARIAKQTGLPVRMGQTKKKVKGIDQSVYTFEVTL